MSASTKPEPILESEVANKLRCPACHTGLVVRAEELICESGSPAHRFPIVDGVPVLIDESRSVFDIESFANRDATFFCDDTPLVRFAKRFVPSLGDNLVADQNYARLKDLVLKDSEHPKTLILGGSIAGAGLESFLDPRIETIDTDVSLGPRARAIVDAHQIPFENGTFDCVTAQAVLEHVIDPFRCVEEIHRVLKTDGLVYIEVPFMQQVHGGRYDFLRFTHLGLRRLLHRFEEIDSGAAEGPGMALAWSIMYFLLSFSTSRPVRGIARITAGILALPLRLFDRFLIDRPGTLEGAPGFYFLGRRSEDVVSDRRIIDSYQRPMAPPHRPDGSRSADAPASPRT